MKSIHKPFACTLFPQTRGRFECASKELIGSDRTRARTRTRISLRIFSHFLPFRRTIAGDDNGGRLRNSPRHPFSSPVIVKRLKLCMKYRARTAAAIILCSVALASQAAQTFDFDVSHVQRNSTTRRIRYSYTVKNTKNAVSRGVTLWLPAPVSQTPNQVCRNLKISRDANLLTDEHGNQVFAVVLDVVPPLGQVTISMEANLLVGDLAYACRGALASPAYSAPQRFVDSADPRIVSRATRFEGATNVDVGKRVFDWVGSHMQPTGRFRAPRGAAYALEYADGDCSEYAFLFTALCRARGIPARCITGVVCKQDSLLKPSMLHGWSEFYDGTRWRLADCQLGVFSTEKPEYVAMRVAVDSESIPLQAHELSRSSDPDLRLTMAR
jgi:hypothetical protein